MPVQILPRLKNQLVSECAKLLTKPLEEYIIRVPNDLEVLKSTLRKGDVLLVEGDQRISQVIRYLTQSSWSHCAIYVGDALVKNANSEAAWARAKFGNEADHLLVEAIEGSGVIASPLSKYTSHNIRICRPEALSRADAEVVIEYACSRIGDRYDLRHILDLARYFFPVSVVPRRWRSAALTLGRDSERAVICSTMIARGLAQVGYPILPQVTSSATEQDTNPLRRFMPRKWRRTRAHFRRRNPKLITPRDFDLSPYFQIVKYSHIPGAHLHYRDIIWDDDETVTVQVEVEVELEVKQEQSLPVPIGPETDVA